MNQKLIIVGIASLLIILVRFRQAIFKKRKLPGNLPHFHLPHGLLKEILFWGIFAGLIALALTKGWAIGSFFGVITGVFLLRYIIWGDMGDLMMKVVLSILCLLAVLSIWGVNLQKKEGALRSFLGRHLTSFDSVVISAELREGGRLRQGETIHWDGEILCSDLSTGQPDEEWTNHFETEILRWTSDSLLVSSGCGYDRKIIIEVRGFLNLERNDQVEGSWVLRSESEGIMASGKVIFFHRELPSPSSGVIEGKIFGLPKVPTSAEKVDRRITIRSKKPYPEFLEGLF